MFHKQYRRAWFFSVLDCHFFCSFVHLYLMFAYANNDDNLFRKMLRNEHYVVKTASSYFCLTIKTEDRNFVIRQLAVAVCQLCFYSFTAQRYA